ncbi:unnamed protein product, partial [Allacma fusca]
MRAQGSKREMNNICNSLAESAAANDDEPDDSQPKETSTIKKISKKRAERSKKSHEIASLLLEMQETANANTVSEILSEDLEDESAGLVRPVVDGMNNGTETTLYSVEELAQLSDPENSNRGELQETVKRFKAKIKKLRGKKQRLQ